MKMSITIPMTYYHQFELIIPVANKNDISWDFTEIDRKLRANIVNIKDATINRALDMIVEKIKNDFPFPMICRLWQNRSWYVERTVEE